MVKRIPVGARYGLRDWLAQRVTAVVMTIAIVILGLALIVCRPADFESWREFVFTGWVRILLFLTVLSLAWHAFIGARDILMDYIKIDWFRLLKVITTV